MKSAKAGTSGAAAVQVSALAVWYEGEERPALQGLNLTIAQGERLLLLGPSGCGKSTMALAMNGIIPGAISGRVDGEIRIGGQPIAQMGSGELCRKVGVLFQDPESQFCMLTVEDEVAFGLENLCISPDLMGPQIARSLALVGLGGMEKLRTDRMSGGMKQRLALACLLAMEPEILILDEPTANLDPAGTRELFQVLRTVVADRGQTLLLIEHKLDDCMDLIDRVVVLDRLGSVAAVGTPAAVFGQCAGILADLGVWQPVASTLVHRLWCGGLNLIPPHPQPQLNAQAQPDSQPQLDAHPFTVSSAVALLAKAGVSAQVVLEAAGRPAAVLAVPGPPALQLKALSYAFGPRQVLDGVELEMPAGHLLAVLGPNGTGKTTLMQLAAGLRPLSCGSVTLLGRDLGGYAAAELAATVGYVFQNPEHQFIRQTVYDEVSYGLQVLGLVPGEVKERAEEILGELGLLERRWANPFSLSQGEKRRLSVATQLVAGQKLLILDEPTFGQDQQTATALMERIVALQRSGRSIVMITHDMQLVAQYATMAAVLTGGRIRYAGTTEALMEQGDLLKEAALELPPAWAVAQGLALGESDRRGSQPGSLWRPSAEKGGRRCTSAATTS